MIGKTRGQLAELDEEDENEDEEAEAKEDKEDMEDEEDEEEEDGDADADMKEKNGGNVDDDKIAAEYGLDNYDDGNLP